MKINKHLKFVALMAGALLMLTTSCEREEDLTLPEENSLVTPIDDTVIPGQYIVVFRDEASKGLSYKVNATYAERTATAKNRIGDILAARGISDNVIERTYSSSVFGFSGQLDANQLDELRRDPNVAYIEQDRIVSLGPPPGKGPGGGGGDGGGNDPQQTPWGISRVGGAVNSTGMAWVIDSGIDVDHPDLNVNAALGYTAFTKGKDAGVDDGDGHGTHVAGTIAAIDNEIGVVGVAAGATVVPVKVLNSRGSGTTSGVIGGVDYVGANASSNDVANMSLGGGVSTTLDNAVIAASNNSGAMFCLAAGNESTNASNSSPARANGPNVRTIASMTSNDGWSSFSNYGNGVDWIAPGSSILSTWRGGGYNTISGTSMASPHAAGVYLLTNNPSGSGSVSGPDGNYTVISH